MSTSTSASASNTGSLVPPGRTPMFENSPSEKGAIFDWQLNRTWWIFFEKLAKAAAKATAAAGAGAAAVIGWDVQDSTPGLDVSDPVIPPRAMNMVSCQIRIKVTDPSTPLQIDIRNNGTSIFSTRPLIAAGTSTRAVQTFTTLAAIPTPIAVGDDVVLDIVQGGAWEVAVYLVSQ